MVERRHGDARLAIGLGPQPLPATLPTWMPILQGLATTTVLQDASIAADPAGRPWRRQSIKNDDGAQGIQIPQSTSPARRRASHPLAAAAAASSSQPPRRA
jgi:hypothetical protein